MVSGPDLLKNEGNKLDFHILGSNTKRESNYEIGQSLVSRALDQTKKIRKTAADIFAKSGPEKKIVKKLENQTKSLGVSQFFRYFFILS